jgi:hypothetical protein
MILLNPEAMSPSAMECRFVYVKFGLSLGFGSSQKTSCADAVANPTYPSRRIS